MNFYQMLYRNSYIRKLEQESRRLRECQVAYENTIMALYELLQKHREALT